MKRGVGGRGRERWGREGKGRVGVGKEERDRMRYMCDGVCLCVCYAGINWRM